MGEPRLIKYKDSLYYLDGQTEAFQNADGFDSPWYYLIPVYGESDAIFVKPGDLQEYSQVPTPVEEALYG